MKSRVMGLLFSVTIVTTTLLNQPTVAWGQFQPLGGFILGNPSCASTADGSGDVTCAVKGSNSALFGIRFNPSTGGTTGFQFLGGFILDDPSCASTGNSFGDVTCAVKGGGSDLFGIVVSP